MNLFKKLVEKKISINDLQEEIKSLKNEIQTLKIRDDEIELKLLELQSHMNIQNQRILAFSSKKHEETNGEIVVSTNEDSHINKIENMTNDIVK